MSALADQYGFTYANYNNDRLEDFYDKCRLCGL